MSLSLVIIPTYNERENIERMIRKVLSLEDNFHVLVVDDGSPDGTGAIVKDLQKADQVAVMGARFGVIIVGITGGGVGPHILPGVIGTSRGGWPVSCSFEKRPVLALVVLLCKHIIDGLVIIN